MSVAKGLIVSALLAVSMQPQVAAARSFTTIHAFNFKFGVAGEPKDGASPTGNLAIHGDVLYGTTAQGGAGFQCLNGCGTVFRVDLKTGAEAVLHSFDNYPDGAIPVGGVVYHGGALYGTTYTGGADKATPVGTVFKVDAETGAQTRLHSFSAGPDGGSPIGGLVEYNGRLYGTTVGYGSSVTTGPVGDNGTLFEVDTATGNVSTRHIFSGVNGYDPGDGSAPAATLVASGGKLFGTTRLGGLPSPDGLGYGTVFEFDPASGAETVIYRFADVVPGDSAPSAGLSFHNNVIYGTTPGGNTNDCSPLGCGTVFSLAPHTRVQTLLKDFDAGPDGAAPGGALVYHDGYFYGITQAGGTSGWGTVFRIDAKTGAETVLYSFTDGADGAVPYCTLVYHAGAFYGTAEAGGTDGWGTVFKLVP